MPAVGKLAKRLAGVVMLLNQKEKRPQLLAALVIFGRNERIRTSDPLNPIQVRYQTAPRSDLVCLFTLARRRCQVACLQQPFEADKLLFDQVVQPEPISGRRERRSGLLFPRRRLFSLLPPAAQRLARPGNGEALFVEQALDDEHLLHVLPPVQPLAGACPARPQRREFRFPVPQHMLLHPGQPTDLADPKIRLIRDRDLIPGRRAYSLILARNILLGVKDIMLRGAIAIVSPVRGLRPTRSLFLIT